MVLVFARMHTSTASMGVHTKQGGGLAWCTGVSARNGDQGNTIE